MQDSQFVNAATFGNRDVIATGRIVNYLGVEINETPKGTLVVGGGTYRSLLLAKGALAGAIKHGITVETEYSPRLQKRYVIADIRYGGVCLHPEPEPEGTQADKWDILDPLKRILAITTTLYFVSPLFRDRSRGRGEMKSGEARHKIFKQKDF